MILSGNFFNIYENPFSYYSNNDIPQLKSKGTPSVLDVSCFEYNESFQNKDGFDNEYICKDLI